MFFLEGYKKVALIKKTCFYWYIFCLNGVIKPDFQNQNKEHKIQDNKIAEQRN